MRSKLIIPGIVAVSLLAPAVAFAQTSAPPDSTGPGTAQSDMAAPHAAKPATHHAMKSTHMKPGTTTGMGSSTKSARPGGESVSRKPAD